MKKKIAVCVDDILFYSKISNAAKELQIESRSFIGLPDEIAEQVRLMSPSVVFLDLNSRKIDTLSLIHSLKSNAVTTAIPVIAFLSHVDIETRIAAISFGCDQVLPRSVFVQKLPEILSGL